MKRKTLENDAESTQLMTPGDMARALRVSARKIRSMKSAGELPPAIKFGRLVRWRVPHVIEWLEERAQEATP